MKTTFIFYLFALVLLGACKVSDLKVSAPQVTQDQTTLKKFIHTDFDHQSCIQCHENKRPQTTPPHGDNLNCIECHKGTPGLDGKRTWINLTKFSHKGNLQSCNKCHLTAANDSRPEPKQAHPSIKYSTLDCVVCHEAKPNKISWKDVKFNQNGHNPAPKSCNSCHEQTRPNSHKINPSTKGMESTDCFACHGSSDDWKDKIKKFNHANAAPKQCLQCHQNDAPKPIENHPSLKEKYSKLDCVLCHSYSAPSDDQKKWTTIIFDHRTHKTATSSAPGSCIVCHKTNNNSLPKSGSHMTGSRSRPECSECHSFIPNKGWKSYKAFDHKNLESNETCVSCHNANSALKYKTATHVPTPLQCNECHSTTAWKPATYTHTKEDSQCLKCHNGVTASGRPDTHKLSKSAECSLCHSQTRWTPAWYDEKYVHSNTGNMPAINIRGKMYTHSGLSKCASCHESKSDSVRYKNNQYAPTCLGCHQKEFSGEYHRGNEAPRLKNCLECHGYNNWDVINKYKN